MDEHTLIRKYLAPLAAPEGLNLQSDCAHLSPPTGHDLIISTDSFVEGVHFLSGDWGANTSERLLRTALSDLAAAAATPAGYQLAIAWPKTASEDWFAAFAKGLAEIRDVFGVSLFGGDLTSINGPMVITATVFGYAKTGQGLTRLKAKAGDKVFVTGHLGGACLGLMQITHPQQLSALPASSHLIAETAFARPAPRFDCRDILLENANACADISDGILKDLGHICSASGVSATIHEDALPIESGALAWTEAQPGPDAARHSLITFGDDYELVFTAPANKRQAIFDMARRKKIKISEIGDILPGEGVTCLDSSSEPIRFEATGYSHKF